MEVLASLLADLGHALGWVAAQALLLVQPLLEGWVERASLKQFIRRLENLSSVSLREDR